MSWNMKWQELTPSQRVWAEVFGLKGLPELDEHRVLAIVNRLPRREATVVRLRFGFQGVPLTYDGIGRQLPRADGKTGVSREIARQELRKALRRLRRPQWHRDWDEAKL